MRISDWSSDVCSSDLLAAGRKSTLLPSGLEFPRTVPRQQMLRVRLPPLRSPLSQLNSVFLAVKRQVEGQPPELADTDVTRDFRLHLGRPSLAAKHQSQPKIGRAHV